MKAELEKIIKKHYDPDTEVLESGKIAEEISEHVFEFINWFEWDNNKDDYHFIKDYTTNSWMHADEDLKPYALAEIYDWWFKNIYSHGGVRMLPVTSSQIKSVGYASGTLYIEFLKGSVYSYKDVPENMFEDFIKFDSKGKFFANAIKGRFEFVKTDKIVVNNELQS